MPAYPTRHPEAHNSILGALFSQFVPLKKWQKKVDIKYKRKVYIKYKKKVDTKYKYRTVERVSDHT